MTTIVLDTGSGYGAIADYLDLRTAVVEEVGDVSFLDRFPRMVRQAESKLSRMLRLREMIATADIAVSNGVGALPLDLADIIGLYDAAGNEFTARVAITSREPTLRYEYIVEGAQIRAPDGLYTLRYYCNIPTITTSNTATNWLLQKHPETYLWAVTEQVLKSLRRAEEAVQVMGLLERELGQLQAADHSTRYGQSVVRMRGGTP